MISRSVRKRLPFNFDFDCISSLFYQVFTDIMIHIKYLGTIDFNDEVSFFQPSFVCNCVENDLAKKQIRNRGKRVTKYAQKFRDITLGISLLLLHYCSKVWQYGLWSFQTVGTKLERFLPKNQHTQRKLLNFENWINGGLRSFQKSEF